jgi:hypothetical protein
MRWSIERETAAGLALAGLIMLSVAVLSYRNGSGFIETSPIDTVSVGVDRMQHNFEPMQREIESGKVAEA